MKFVGIIPARFASTRFPGKPLVNIGGKTMIQRVYEQASKVLENVVVATDDDRIWNAVLEFGGDVVMTSPQHASGTDRCAEAADNQLVAKLVDEYSELVIINIQGDEPFIHPGHITKLMDCFNDNSTEIATLVKQITFLDDIFNPNKPKVVINCSNFALYFSRSPIPFIRNHDKDEWVNKHKFFKHIGIYAYRYDVLKRITKLSQSTLELAESLEQNRWIENNYKIKVDFTEEESISIDTKEDLEKLLADLEKNKIV